MNIIALTVVCLACAGLGRRVQSSLEQIQRNFNENHRAYEPHYEARSSHSPDLRKWLATFSEAFNPAAAAGSVNPRTRSSGKIPTSKSSGERATLPGARTMSSWQLESIARYRGGEIDTGDSGPSVMPSTDASPELATVEEEDVQLEAGAELPEEDVQLEAGAELPDAESEDDVEDLVALEQELMQALEEELEAEELLQALEEELDATYERANETGAEMPSTASDTEPPSTAREAAEMFPSNSEASDMHSTDSEAADQEGKAPLEMGAEPLSVEQQLMSKIMQGNTAAREWEVENMERYKRGEITFAELGMANLQHLMRDPSMMTEIAQMLLDPEIQLKLKHMMSNPDFREQAEEAMTLSAGGPRDWELENIERYKSGEFNTAELGMANLKKAMRDPLVLEEMRQMLRDPEYAAQIKKIVSDPFFQEQAMRTTSPENLAELKSIIADQIIHDQINVEQHQATPETGGWAVIRRLFDQMKTLLSPSHEYAKVKTDLFGDYTRECGWEPDDESWRVARKKIHNIELPTPARKRVLHDLRQLKSDGEELGLEVEDCEVLTDWIIKMTGAPRTVYEGEIYRLRVRFHPDYPLRPPEVVFLRPAPLHEHIYSDGKICLSILTTGWDPRMTVKSMSLSILSMMSSAKQKMRPPDNNSSVVMSQGLDSRRMTWEFHDDNC